jgi:hypothetical protein
MNSENTEGLETTIPERNPFSTNAKSGEVGEDPENQ